MPCAPYCGTSCPHDPWDHLHLNLGEFRTTFGRCRHTLDASRILGLFWSGEKFLHDSRTILRGHVTLKSSLRDARITCENDSHMRTPKTTKEDARKALLHLGTGSRALFRYKKGYFETVEAHTHTHTRCKMHLGPTLDPKSCKTIYSTSGPQRMWTKVFFWVFRRIFVRLEKFFGKCCILSPHSDDRVTEFWVIFHNYRILILLRSKTTPNGLSTLLVSSL